MDDRIGTPGGTPDKPALFFRDAEEFGRWLELHHDTETELWMGLYRKGHPDAGLTWEAAVREALCWGWIDSKAQGIDEHTRRQRWTPRKPGSNWSSVNIAAVGELTAEGRMRPPGERKPPPPFLQPSEQLAPDVLRHGQPDEQTKLIAHQRYLPAPETQKRRRRAQFSRFRHLMRFCLLCYDNLS